jgi:hypothetical protein
MTNNFNIYSFHKDEKLTTQAQIQEVGDTYTIKMNPLPPSIYHMESYMNELFDLMMKYEKENPHDDIKIYKTKRYEYMNGEYVEGTIFHRVLMRKGSYFYVIQKSDRGTRFLLYALDRVHHSSNAFGFSMRVPNAFEQRKEMKKNLSKQTFALSLDLIENDSLYFL